MTSLFFTENEDFKFYKNWSLIFLWKIWNHFSTEMFYSEVWQCIDFEHREYTESNLYNRESWWMCSLHHAFHVINFPITRITDCVSLCDSKKKDLIASVTDYSNVSSSCDFYIELWQQMILLACAHFNICLNSTLLYSQEIFECNV